MGDAKMLSSVITKNLNWEILAKSLFSIRRWDGVKGEDWTVNRFTSELGKKGGSGVLEWAGKVDTPMHAMNWRKLFIDAMAHRHKYPKQITLCDTNTLTLLIILIIIDT